MTELRSGKMTTTSVRRRISRLSRYGVVRPDLAPQVPGERGERQHVGAGGVEVVVHLGQLHRDGVQQLVVLGVHRRGVGWSYTLCGIALTAGHELFGHALGSFAA